MKYFLMTNNSYKSASCIDNMHKTDQEENTTDIELLIDLKFDIEKEINTLFVTFENQKNRKLQNITNNSEISIILQMYNDNITKAGTVFLIHQNALLEKINALLLKKCKHSWIDDVIDGPFSSRNYCYCSKCFLRKSP
jgi:hypothetical protein